MELIIIISIGLLIGGSCILIEYAVYRKNRSSIRFVLNRNVKVNFEKQYSSLCKKHNELSEKNKKILHLFIIICIPTIVTAIFTVKSLYSSNETSFLFGILLFCMCFIINVSVPAIKSSKIRKSIESINKEYYKEITI